MCGARAVVPVAAFILEEGTGSPTSAGSPQAIGQPRPSRRGAARHRRHQGRRRGHGDGVFINTAGIGLVPDGVDIRPRRAGAGRRGHRQRRRSGVHGIAIMSVREGLEFGTDDRAATARRCTAWSRRCSPYRRRHARAARPDPRRRGGRRSTRSPAASGVGLELVETDLPSREMVANACALLGLDPLLRRQRGQARRHRARHHAERVWPRCRRTRSGQRAVIGDCVADHPAWWSPDPARRHSGGRPAARRAVAADLLRFPERIPRRPAAVSASPRARYLAGGTNLGAGGGPRARRVLLPTDSHGIRYAGPDGHRGAQSGVRGLQEEPELNRQRLKAASLSAYEHLKGKGVDLNAGRYPARGARVAVGAVTINRHCVTQPALTGRPLRPQR